MSTAIVQQVKHLPQAQQEMAVSMYLEQARDRLADALERTGPEAVANIKAEIATAAEATKQLGLSKEIRDDATEMVRRADFALKKAIRKGQAEGVIETEEEARRRAVAQREVNQGRADQSRVGTLIKPKPTDFATHSELYHTGGGIMDLDATDEEFEEALDKARSEGNLSRANVVRNVKGQRGGESRQQRADLIQKLAREGYSSRQMPAKVGVGEQAIKRIAQDFDIDIPADRVIGKSHRVNSNRVLSGVTESLSAAAYSLQQIDPLDLDQEQAQEWVDSLTESLSAIRKALNPIKESLRG